MKKNSLIRLACLCAIVVLAFVLNPSPDKHRAKIESVTAERSQLAKVLALGTLAAFVSEYHSLGLASYTRINDKIASIGAFGLVFVVD